MATPSGESHSFANPNIREIGEDQYVLSFFMPYEGNEIKENGNLIYYIPKNNKQEQVYQQ